MSGRIFTDQDLHLALDGELPADERADFDKWLLASPEARIRYSRFEGDVERLRKGLSGVLNEPVPPALTALLSERPKLSRSYLRPLMRIAAVIALVAAGTAAGYFYGADRQQPLPPEERLFADNAIQAHDMYAAEKLHVVEVKADQRDHLQSWLSKRVGLPLIAPDLTAQGYELIGGRLLPNSGKAAAQFMYQNSTGERISLYITREKTNTETGFRSHAEGATRALYWMEEEYSCAITGDAPEAILTSVADAAYRQLLAAETK